MEWQAGIPNCTSPSIFHQISMCTTLTRLLSSGKYPSRGMYCPCSIVAHANIIFVADWQKALVHRIEMPHEYVSSWPTVSKLIRLSVTKEGLVVVAHFDVGVIGEYTSIGTCLRKFIINAADTAIFGPHHAIKLDQDRFPDMSLRNHPSSSFYNRYQRNTD